MLTLKNVHTSYGNIQALKEVTMEVHEGEIVSLIGANGAGKTTTLKTISGLLKPKSGQILYEGVDLVKKNAHEQAKMGISHVPEGRQIFLRMSVLDNLELGFYSTRKTREEKDAFIETFFEIFPRLKGREHQLAGTLSGGEQQMLAMGRATACNPRLLMLDEPSMGLSPIYVEEIFRMIRRLNDQGVTILLVEQNAHMALAISHRAYVLETGKIVLEGPSEILKNDESIKKAYLGV